MDTQLPPYHVLKVSSIKTTLEAKTLVNYMNEIKMTLLTVKLQRQSGFSALSAKEQHQTKPFPIFRGKTAVLVVCVSDYFGISAEKQHVLSRGSLPLVIHRHGSCRLIGVEPLLTSNR